MEGDDDEEELEPLLSDDGVAAPSWYAKAKRTAERKQEAEKALWNGTAPSAAAGPFPLGPQGRTWEPLQQSTERALKAANAQQRKLVAAFFEEYGGTLPRALNPSAASGAASGGGESGGEPRPRSPETESALVRAEMLALGLSRSSTSSGSTRRLRLLQELESSVRELEGEGFDDLEALGQLKEQIRKSYETAPPEFIKDARRADLFNEYTPRMSVAEIAAEFASMAGERLGKVSDGIEKGIENADWDSLDPRRPRGERPKGNKIQIGTPQRPKE